MYLAQEKNSQEDVLTRSSLSDWHEHVKNKKAASRCESTSKKTFIPAF
jgi:hypothetical protein